MTQERGIDTKIKPEQSIRVLADQYFNSPKFLSYKPKTQEFYKQDINHFLHFAESNGVQDISLLSKTTLIDYVVENIQSTTIYRRKSAISGFLNWTEEVGAREPFVVRYHS